MIVAATIAALDLQFVILISRSSSIELRRQNGKRSAHLSMTANYGQNWVSAERFWRSRLPENR
jgi:hypothetical protein